MFPKTLEITAIRTISWSIPLGGPAQGLPMSTTGNSETACRHHRFPWMEEKLVDLWPMLKLPLVKLCYSKKKNIRRRWVHCLRSSGASHSTVSFYGMGWHPIDVHFSVFHTAKGWSLVYSTTPQCLDEDLEVSREEKLCCAWPERSEKGPCKHCGAECLGESWWDRSIFFWRKSWIFRC